MTYNESTNLTGIIQHCEKYTGLGYGNISGNTEKLKEFTGNVNITQSKIWHTVFKATGCWEYDDSNYTTLPQATADLASGTAKYALPTGALSVKRVEMKDSSGNWFVLTPLIRDEIKVALDEYRKTDGLPYAYRLIGETLELFPAPNYNSTGGLKVYFDRSSVEFAYTDTTKTPSLISDYQYLLPIGASFEWLKINLPDNTTTARLEKDWEKGLLDIEKFYNKRFPAKHKVMRRAYSSFK